MVIEEFFNVYQLVVGELINFNITILHFYISSIFDLILYINLYFTNYERHKSVCVLELNIYYGLNNENQRCTEEGERVMS